MTFIETLRGDMTILEILLVVVPIMLVSLALFTLLMICICIIKDGKKPARRNLKKLYLEE